MTNLLKSMPRNKNASAENIEYVSKITTRDNTVVASFISARKLFSRVKIVITEGENIENPGKYALIQTISNKGDASVIGVYVVGPSGREPFAVDRALKGYAEIGLDSLRRLEKIWQ